VTPGDKLRRVERLNYVIGGGLTIGAALSQPRDIALGIAVGVTLTCLNFFFLRRLVTRWTRDAAKGLPTSGSAALMVPKMIGLMAAVVLSLAFLPISAVAFAIGYSVFVASIFIEAVIELAFETPEDEHSHG
jgi:hypothetical protein